jgi:hypothetical protein
MPINEHIFQQLALADHNEGWELLGGALRRKPSATSGCSETVHEVGFALMRQMDRNEWHSRINGGYLRVSEETYYRPDGFVIPAALSGFGLDKHRDLERYSIPMPLVIEVWPRYTREYVWEHRGEPAHRIRDYQNRGDEEIWLIHSYNHRLTSWRRRPDGTYEKLVVSGGIVNPAFSPTIEIDLGSLFTKPPRE